MSAADADAETALGSLVRRLSLEVIDSVRLIVASPRRFRAYTLNSSDGVTGILKVYQCLKFAIFISWTATGRRAYSRSAEEVAVLA